MTQLVVIRFSSFGDIVQLLHALSIQKLKTPDLQIHWVTKEEFAPFLQQFPWIHQVWLLPKSNSLADLFALGHHLFSWTRAHAEINPVLIFDAHNNLRSGILTAQLLTLRFLNFFRNPLTLLRFGKNWVYFRRSKQRLRRFAYFNLGVKTFRFPVRGVDTFLKPLESGFAKLEVQRPKVVATPQTQNLNLNKILNAKDLAKSKIVLAPSAAWELKRWPVEHWKTLVRLMPSEKFILVGGPKDDFCKEIFAVAPDRIENMAGKWSWAESTQAVAQAKAVVSGDTGILHLADFLKIPTLALIGPTAFGHPTSLTTRVVEKKLYCKPCSKDGRGGCKNKIFKTCLNDIPASFVVEEYLKLEIPSDQNSEPNP